MANKFAVFTISMFGIMSALSVWSPAWAEEAKEESKGTVGDFFKSFGKRMKENAEGTNNRISDEYSDAQQQIFKVNDGSMYHCVANPEGKFYAPGKARYGHTAYVNKKLVFVDDSAQQVGNKLRIDVLKSISGGDCAKLMQAGKLVRLDGPEGAAATSGGDQGRNTEIVGYRWEFANHKCRAKRDTKGNITVSPRGTELTQENCERVQAILDQSEEAYKNGDKATSQRIKREAEAYEFKTEVENMQAAFDNVETQKKGAAPVDTLEKTRQRNYEVCLKANADDPKVCNVLLQSNK